MSSQHEVLLQVVKALEEGNIPYVIVGSFASAAHGVIRSTMDADLIADLRSAQVPQFIAALQNEFYLDAGAIRGAIAHRASFNLIHYETSFKVDIFIPRERDFDKAQFERRVIIPLMGEKHPLPVASVEDTILAKLEWYKAGGETSQRQWRDVTTLLSLHYPVLDLAYMDVQAEALEVRKLLTRAIRAIQDQREENR